MPEEGRTDTGPIDSDVLERIGRRLRGSERFSSVEYRPPSAPNAVIADFDTGNFPAAVERACLRSRWFETDDFNIHYTEQYTDDNSWECRWDRHPNEHNGHSHVHPPPDASTPGDDVAFATDWRTVLTRVLSALDERIKAFWE